jgi:ribosomal protein S18 acetylase RimI-like enzyme
MLERRGYDLDLSFGAFNEGNLVGFTLNGIGNWNGKRTAYDVCTGVIKEFRKKGIATKILHKSIPVLREYGVSQYLLEVIRTNEPAVELYRKAGFKVTREFEYYFSSKSDINIRENRLNLDYIIKKMDQPDWEKFKSFWDFNPSWQNSIDSLNRKIHHFTILGIFANEDLLGYTMIENHTGDIPQLAIKQSHRRIGLATTLLKNILTYSETDKIKIINTVTNYKPFQKFTSSVKLNPGYGQYEMLLEL